MTGGELLNLFYEEMEESGLTDSEIVLADVFDLLSEIDIPTEYYPAQMRVIRCKPKSSTLSH